VKEIEKEIMIKLRNIYIKIQKKKIHLKKIEKQVHLSSGDLLWEFCCQNNFYKYGKKKARVTYDYFSRAGDLICYYF
jgi:capsule polysaccharide export protein KpsE/RkpR